MQRTVIKHSKSNVIQSNQIEQVYECASCGHPLGHKIVDKHGRVQFDATPPEGNACEYCRRTIKKKEGTQSFI